MPIFDVEHRRNVAIAMDFMSIDLQVRMCGRVEAYVAVCLEGRRTWPCTWKAGEDVWACGGVRGRVPGRVGGLQVRMCGRVEAYVAVCLEGLEACGWERASAAAPTDQQLRGRWLGRMPRMGEPVGHAAQQVAREDASHRGGCSTCSTAGGWGVPRMGERVARWRTGASV
eukprot:366508-Chlamydomonas_euryale.AAC.1